MNRALRSYVRRGHRRVEGWIEPEILRLTTALSTEQHRSGVRGSVVEIGVHHGRFFLGLHLTRAVDEPRSVAIDLYDDQERNVDSSGLGDEAAFRKNLDAHAQGDSNVAIVAADSSTLDGARVRELAGGPVRLFSVDGGHTSELVALDMHTAADSLAEGGVILGDDVFNFEWPGAAEGTFRFLDESSEVVPFAVGFNKVLFTTPAHADRYRSVTQETAKRRLWDFKELEMHGEPVVILRNSQRRKRPRMLARRLLRR